ncbi:MAG: hypothetical protein ACI9P5_003059 [Saprospiraceae bacterium]|jgi:hypothetical protein|tara:strand:- start:806 stop:1081 length:276 start_codon:yes stop_codon:yes gene_type:complete
MANNKSNKAANTFVEAAKERIVMFNKFVIDTAEEVVDMGIKRTADWQGVAEKAIQGGLKVSAKQQDLVFDVLESVKGQIVTGQKKLTKLSK